MSEKRLNNTIFLMFLVTGAYSAAHGLTNEQFLELDRKCSIINLIAECPDIFDSMSESEMVAEIDDYVKNFQ